MVDIRIGKSSFYNEHNGDENNHTYAIALCPVAQMAVRDALTAFMAATAQAEATREAQRGGIELAKGREDTYRGRKPAFTRCQFEDVVAGLDRGEAVAAIAKATGLSRQKVYCIRDERPEAEASLARQAA